MGLLQGKPALSPRGVVPESLFEDETHPLPAWDSLTKEQQTDLALPSGYLCCHDRYYGYQYWSGIGYFTEER